MKKYIISAVVIIALIAYFFYAKMNDSIKLDEPKANVNPVTTTEPVATKPKYKDGKYTGKNVKFLYGNIQAEVVISGGKISDIKVPVYPNDNPTSIEINEVAMVVWKTEVIASQQTKVSVVSRATDSGVAFTQSLDSALELALNS